MNFYYSFAVAICATRRPDVGHSRLHRGTTVKPGTIHGGGRGGTYRSDSHACTRCCCVLACGFRHAARLPAQFALQGLNLAMIIFSALMIWKTLMVVTHSESPVVVVLRYGR